MNCELLSLNLPPVKHLVQATRKASLSLLQFSTVLALEMLALCIEVRLARKVSLQGLLDLEPLVLS